MEEKTKYKIKKNSKLKEAYDKGIENAKATETKPIVQERITDTKLAYKVSYGMCAPWCGNKLPRTSILVEPHYREMKPMCMCIQEGSVSTHVGSIESQIPGVLRSFKESMDVFFTVNTNNLNLSYMLANSGVDRMVSFSLSMIRDTLATFLDVLKANGFFREFAERTGLTEFQYIDLIDVRILPSVASEDQFIVHLTISGEKFHKDLMTVLEMEYMRLFMITIACIRTFPRWNSFNYPTFGEVFYTNLVTDLPMIVENLWHNLEVIKSTSNFDQ